MLPGIERITLGHLATLGKPVANALVRKVEYSADPDAEGIVAGCPQLIHVMNHGPMLAPYVASTFLADAIVNAGGAQRVPFATVHRRLYSLPGVRDVIKWAFDADKPLGFNDVVETFKQGPFTDYMVLPEGDNEMFGDMHSIRPFKSHRYMELAIETGLPILVTVHHGTEDWALAFRLDARTSRWLSTFSPALSERLGDTPIFNLQGIPMPIERLQMRSQLFRPSLTVGDLAPNPRQRRLQILAESRKVVDLMRQMLAEMQAAPLASPVR